MHAPAGKEVRFRWLPVTPAYEKFKQEARNAAMHAGPARARVVDDTADESFTLRR